MRVMRRVRHRGIIARLDGAVAVIASEAIQGNVGSPTIPGLLRRHEGVERWASKDGRLSRRPMAPRNGDSASTRHALDHRLCLAAPESQIATCAGEAGPKLCPAPRICFAQSLRRAGFLDALHGQGGALPLDPELDVGVGVAPAIGG
jgi:hypothetical protein